MQCIAHVSLLVYDYAEGIDLHRGLGFELIEDTKLSEENSEVIVRPMETSGFSLLLAKAASTRQNPDVGRQAGGRVFLFLYTNNLWIIYIHLW